MRFTGVKEVSEMFERRVFERVAKDFVAKYSAKGSEDLGEVKGLNVSGSGIMVRGESKIPETGILEMWLSSPGLKEPIHTTCRIAWQKEVDSGNWLAGFKFYKPNLMQLSHLMATSDLFRAD